MENKQLLELYAFAKNQGLIWGPEPLSVPLESIPGHYTLGPLGKQLRNKIDEFLRMKFNQELDYVEIETPLVYSDHIWKTSGHLDKFKDPIIRTQSGQVYRLDKLIEEQFEINYDKLSEEQIIDYSNKLNPIDQNDPFETLTELKYISLMMQTISGSRNCALRPETATPTYLTFPQLSKYFGEKLPIKVFQIGKSFRNEISPRHSIIRGREFSQFEAQLFLDTNEIMENYFDFDFESIQNEHLPVLICGQIEQITLLDCLKKYHMETSFACSVWTAINSVNELLPVSRLRLRRHDQNELIFYAKDAYDIEVELDHIGWTELAGIHDRSTYDLQQHFGIDHVRIIEIALGIDRLIFALLDVWYDKKNSQDGKSVWKIPKQIAPIKISVLPLHTNDSEMLKMAHHIHSLLKTHFQTEYDEKQRIGKRYLKSGLKGIPYCVTIDPQSLSDQTVTIRDRDTEEQIRINIDELVTWFYQQLR